MRKPEGGDIAGEQKITFATAPKQLTASIQEGPGQVSKDRVNIAFTPSQKLEQGIYTLFIYDGCIIGKCAGSVNKVIFLIYCLVSLNGYP